MPLRVGLPDGRWVTIDDPGPHLVGRADEAVVRLVDPRVSRRHATLEVSASRWWWTDTSSSGSYAMTGPVTRFAVVEPTTLRLGAPDGPPLRLDPSPAEIPDQATSIPTGTPANVEAGPATAPLVIGRDPACDLVLDGDLLVSRRHASLHRDVEGWHLIDLGSANGTSVDGRRIDHAVLRPGNHVRIGAQSFVFDPSAPLRPTTSSDAAVLTASGVTVEVAGGRRLLAGVDFTASAATLTAIVGPSGAGKSTLLRVLTGQLPPSRGTVRVLGDDLYRHYEQLRAHVGYVPQEDIVVPQLDARTCLRFGAALRFPEEVSVDERDARVEEVLRALGLDQHASTTVASLSGGQRKRVSVALELLTRPDLLVLDEPTTGLDPGFEQATMELLRELADSGQAVVVVTHAVASLERCDQVVFLGTGGWVGFVGPARDALGHFGAEDYPSVFRRLQASNAADVPDPSPQPTLPGSPQTTPVPDDAEIPYPNGFRHQLSTLIRRQIAVLRSEGRTLLVLLLSSVVPAGLLTGLTSSNALAPDGALKSDARMLIGALVVTIGVIGVANGVREIVKESPMYRRERAAGLRRSSYLASKLVVFSAVTVVQAIVLVVIATIRAGDMSWGNIAPGRLELIVDLSVTGCAALAVGLLISALVSTSEKAVAAIPLLFVVLWLFSGTVSNLAEKPVLREVALLSPSNWGTAAAANTVDLLTLSPCRPSTAPPSEDAVNSPAGGGSELQTPSREPGTAAAPVSCDARWHRGMFDWLFALAMQVAIGAAAVLGADVALARKEPLAYMRRRHLLGDARRRLRRRITR